MKWHVHAVQIRTSPGQIPPTEHHSRPRRVPCTVVSTLHRRPRVLLQQNHPIVGLTHAAWNQRASTKLQGAGPAQASLCSLERIYDARRRPDRISPLRRPFEENPPPQLRRRVVRPFCRTVSFRRTRSPATKLQHGRKSSSPSPHGSQIGAERLGTGHYGPHRKSEPPALRTPQRRLMIQGPSYLLWA